MAFQTVEIAPSIYHLQSGANSGLIAHDGQAIVIDTGLDDDAGRKIKKAVESLNLRLAAVILTHGHADHFGGTAYLRRSLPPFTVYAPPLEDAFIANPSLEGIMLSAGALPFDQLQGRFSFAPGCTVDHQLPLGPQTIAGAELEIVSLAGHSPNMFGVRVGKVLFCADAFLPVATLAKYPVPFTVHIGKALNVLEQLDQLIESPAVILAPGHGLHLMPPEAREVIAANIAALNRLVSTVEHVLSNGDMNEGDLTQAVCRELGDDLPSSVGYYLARATVQAALVYLYEQGRVTTVHNGKFAWALTEQP